MRSALIRDAIVISTAVGAFGVSFGVLAASAGLSVPQAMAMSLFVFTGASQFAAVSVVSAGGALSAAVGSGLMLAMRNTAYTLALAPTLRGSVWRRALAAHLVVDETAAMALAQSSPDRRRLAFWVTAGLLFTLWNAGTLAGALGAQRFGDPARLGLDVAFPAAFVALVAPLVRRGDARMVAALGIVIALVCVPFVPAGVPVIAAAAAAV
ncbi:MAG: AzlC family ABC transporter permease, partial [Chloroflexi bacterium]|nr:AzlC family ABC transporter permease [Chloroflexota bacterium]